MKYFIPVVFAALALVFCSSSTGCSGEPKWVETGTGLKYQVLQKGDGEMTKAGDLVSVHYTGTLMDGTKFDSSVDRGKPFTFPLGQSAVIKGWDEGVALMKIGDKFNFHIPADLGYGDKGAGGVIPPNADLLFEVELLSTIGAFADEPFNVEGKTAETTDSGLQVYRMNTTEGARPAAGQQVQVHYTGYLEDGTVFDSSIKRGKPLPFPLGQGRVIKGWDEGIGMLRVGEEARLIIPSDLGYGERGAPPHIPANATLIFDVKLMAIN